MEDEEEKHIEMEEEDVEKASSAPSDDSFINDDDSDDPIMDDDDDNNQQSLPEEPLTDKEIEELIAELLETESKAAEAQEALEEESVSKVEADVREELSQTLKGDELENAVADEMATFKEEWETVLDELETESAHLLVKRVENRGELSYVIDLGNEQLDGAGIELPSLYKWIESQAPHGCCTEAWRNRTQWVGSELTSDLNGAIADAEKYLQIHRPVRRQVTPPILFQKHGKVLEEGASGFLAKKLAGNDGSEAQGGSSGVDWGSFSKLCSDNSSSSMGTTSFGSKDWASVYLASTPQQAAELGLKFPGVDESLRASPDTMIIIKGCNETVRLGAEKLSRNGVTIIVRGISWTMPGWIIDVLHSWEEAGSHGIDRSNGELSRLVFGGQFGKKEILDALRLWATLCMRSS
ncbi:hypothetical protein H5410_022400 [Solanum commersonii]|uniref:Uncharacterized protein n=1 Tax=Solanum commersonii TaxID=4109 RepID=A0A9J5ZGN1_SOLCO|nr:hypothetical protein H5410_022400 [Solanum commersonii]